MDIEHAAHCGVWEWVVGERTLNNTRPCACGARERQTTARNEALARFRPLLPLKMSDGGFLRTLGIKPTEEAP